MKSDQIAFHPGIGEDGPARGSRSAADREQNVSEDIIQHDQPGFGTADTGEDEYEEITSDEVDRVLAALEDLTETVQSENIKSYLEEAMDGIYFLVYDETDEDDGPLGEAA